MIPTWNGFTALIFVPTYGMLWDVGSKVLLLHQAFETGHDVGQCFSDCFGLENLNLKLGTWSQQASIFHIFSDVKFDHLLGFYASLTGACLRV